MPTLQNFAVRLIPAIVLAAIPVAVTAQWPDYPTPGVPKTADGKPNLTGPVPKTADGHPNLSGIWERDAPVPAGSPAAPPPASAPAGFGPVNPSTNSFFNIGVLVQGGLPFQPWALELRKSRMAANNKDNPDAHCLPLGLMQLHLHPQPRKIIQTPGLVIILYEAQAGVRQIFTDGRPLPASVPEPWWYGYSVGTWDGEALVVETTGLRDDVWLDVEGSPLTSAGRMTERFRRVDYGHLAIGVTVDDAKAYTKPWTVTINQKVMLNTDLIEFICSENEKDAPHLTSK